MTGFATLGPMAEVTEQQPRGHCLNCGATLAGDYCSQCGQRDTGKDLRFADLLSELVGQFFTWDSRIWRTLVPLLVRPGFLTAEFMAGRRARYVPPLRLYLIISFALFLALSFGSRSLVEEGVVVTGEEAAEHLDPNALATLEKLEQASGIDLDIDLGEGEGAAAYVGVGLVDSDSPRWLQHLEQRIKGNAGRVERDPQAFIDQLVEYLPQMMFLLLPVFALLLKLCYLFSPYHYLQHLVFSLNYHSFVFLLYLIGTAVERFAVHYDGLLFLALLVYLPVGLWRAYGTGPAGAIGRAALIYLAYGILLAFAFGLVVALALLLM